MNQSTVSISFKEHPLSVVLASLRKDKFFLLLFSSLILLSIQHPSKIASYPALVDWPTIGALTGLLVLTKGLELSGSLHRFGQHLIGLMATERAMAVCLVITAAILSTVLTNDVALFVIVPLTVGVCRIAKLPTIRLIVFEALAVNAGSALTPIGNPQNLFLWQFSKVSFGNFVIHMLPLVALLMATLLAVVVAVFKVRAIQLTDREQVASVDRTMLCISLVLYLPFLVATDLRYAGTAVTTVLLAFLILRPQVLAQLDWGLLLVFILMFIDLRLISSLSVVQEGMHNIGLDHPKHLYFASIAISQIVSNVPAAIAMTEYSANWSVIAYAVNIGGFGLAVGSLANLIALRMAGDSRGWLSFHCYAIPFLCVAMILGYAVLACKNML
ncbi:SLC13 family permease [Undibacterium sp.]|uniref:SLC13 family permease n=1 Tax=Undibacterium sp. TaxID=1914977 RepID=UPI002C4C22FC|nr:SLC13 family permease [Undibacterium sp.]HTD06221.1 SLC13 family permease [Undibacterium sp.]